MASDYGETAPSLYCPSPSLRDFWLKENPLEFFLWGEPWNALWGVPTHSWFRNSISGGSNIQGHTYRCTGNQTWFWYMLDSRPHPCPSCPPSGCSYFYWFVIMSPWGRFWEKLTLQGRDEPVHRAMGVLVGMFQDISIQMITSRWMGTSTASKKMRKVQR